MDRKKAVREETTQEAERTSVRIRSRAEDEGFVDSSRAPEGSFFRSEEERATTLVLMESGAFWPTWVKEIQRRAPNSIVEVQSASESVEGFGGRVLRRLLSLRDRGVKLRAAVYAASSPSTEQERAVRRLLCSTLLDVLGDFGELVLSGEGWSTWGVDARSRADLMALAGDLSHQLPGSTVPLPPRSLPPTGSAGTVGGGREAGASSPVPISRRVTVSVRFGGPPDESGVHKAARAVDQGAVDRGAIDRGALVRRTEAPAGVDDDADDGDELTREIA